MTRRPARPGAAASRGRPHRPVAGRARRRPRLAEPAPRRDGRATVDTVGVDIDRREVAEARVGPGAHLPRRAAARARGDLLPRRRIRAGQSRHRPPPVRRVRAPRPLHGHLGRLPAGARTPLSRRRSTMRRACWSGWPPMRRAGHRHRPAGGRGQQRRRRAGRPTGSARRRRVGAAGGVPAAASAGARRPADAVEGGVPDDPGLRRTRRGAMWRHYLATSPSPPTRFPAAPAN